jgi:predicted dienelactone hydrolase
MVVCASAFVDNVGFVVVQAPDPPGPALEVGSWYPTAAEPSPQRLELFTQNIAPNARVMGSGHPLVVMSHGNGGSMGGHYDTALALAHAGFVVAAMTHTGDNYRDHSNELRLEDRPRAVVATINFMLTQWPHHAAIDPARIGMFGFSAGGFTALVAIGGKPDLPLLPPYCASHETTFVCQLVKSHPPPTPVPQSAWASDPRIKAAVIAAPALGLIFTSAGLHDVTLPVQLWAAADDHVLPVADNAEVVRAALPHPPEYHYEPGADHFDFLAPCSDALAAVAPAICEDKTGFDRAAFHARFNAAVVTFLQNTLSKPQN